jgi:ubiquinone/menaquinone biosynthesis C-methylase UbiE
MENSNAFLTVDGFLQDFSDEDYLASSHDRYSLIARKIKELNPKTILDIGVCTGKFYTAHLPDFVKGKKVYGVDVDDNYIDIARQRGITAERANIETDPLPFGNKFFDVLVCDSMLEHTLKPNHMFAEMRRVLKDDGKLILSVPSGVSVLNRWNQLRGANPFYSLIDNLATKDYMKRCAILYSIPDLEKIMRKTFMIRDTHFLNLDDAGKKITTMRRLCRLVSQLRPSLKDGILIVASPI